MFTEKLDLKLIGLVRDNTVLYDHNNPQYMDFNAREVVWQKIGDELKRPAAVCKARWINIRDINRRILRKTLSSSGKRVKLYKYESDLAFMRPFYRDILIQNGEFSWDEKNQRDCDVEDDPDIPDHNTDDSNDEKPIKAKGKKSGIKKKRKKRKYEEVEVENPSASIGEPSTAGLSEFDPCDPVDSFLLSIGATLKTFSPYHLNVAKSKIFAVVQEHDLQQIVQKKSDMDDKTPLNMI
ncbi:uncharacterized protein LOC134789545 [Cydia splendana]|uniref:uncharacterized protein LOC134789545 n=1 Tax=Cydia splendana TaxID=1100963 RepID=UPI00212F803F